MKLCRFQVYYLHSLIGCPKPHSGVVTKRQWSEFQGELQVAHKYNNLSLVSSLYHQEQKFPSMHLLKVGVDLRSRSVLTSAIEISEGTRPAPARLALPTSLKWMVMKCPRETDVGNSTPHIQRVYQKPPVNIFHSPI